MNNIKLYILLFTVFALNFTYAQQEKAQLFKGTLGTKNIELYMSPQENGCGGFPAYFYNSIYKYESSKQWIQLATTQSKKSNFAFVEHQFTGALILKKGDNTFTGIWISNDGKKQFKVTLKKVELTANQVEKLEDILEQVNYENNDC